MQLSSPRFKSVAVTAGLTFWFVIITTAIGIFSLEFLLIFSSLIFAITQIFSYKVSKGLDALAIFNTKIFLGALFIFVISIYGILFKLLRIDLLRLKTHKETFWLDVDETKPERIRKQY
jgi:glycosyltransferase involved in cell wall biosynthesis|tara:strand:- start:3649 stop:4005 length:357 start_codon:yes stop_codon:yes gene_type:complete